MPCLRRLELIRPSESTFLWLNCLDDPDFRFVVLEPGDVIAGYEIEISDEDLESDWLPGVWGVASRPESRHNFR